MAGIDEMDVILDLRLGDAGEGKAGWWAGAGIADEDVRVPGKAARRERRIWQTRARVAPGRVRRMQPDSRRITVDERGAEGGMDEGCDAESGAAGFFLRLRVGERVSI